MKTEPPHDEEQCQQHEQVNKKTPLNGEEDASQLQALAVKVATEIIYVQLKLIP